MTTAVGLFSATSFLWSFFEESPLKTVLTPLIIPPPPIGQTTKSHWGKSWGSCCYWGWVNTYWKKSHLQNLKGQSSLSRHDQRMVEGGNDFNCFISMKRSFLSDDFFKRWFSFIRRTEYNLASECAYSIDLRNSIRNSKWSLLWLVVQYSGPR